ncbi:hypothetical protein ACFX1W_015874 [Malus domestica]
MMVLVIPGRLNTVPHSDSVGNVSFQLIGSCLMDMARKGVVSEDKVDTFNFPVYYMTPQELEAAVERNEYFSLKKLETQFGEEILDELFDSYLKKLEEQPSIIASATETAIIFLAVLKRK